MVNGGCYYNVYLLYSVGLCLPPGLPSVVPLRNSQYRSIAYDQKASFLHPRTSRTTTTTTATLFAERNTRLLEAGWPQNINRHAKPPSHQNKNYKQQTTKEHQKMQRGHLKHTHTHTKDPPNPTHHVDDVGQRLRPREREGIRRAQALHPGPRHGIQVTVEALALAHADPQPQAQQHGEGRPQVLEGHGRLLGARGVRRVGRLVGGKVGRDAQAGQQLLRARAEGGEGRGEGGRRGGEERRGEGGGGGGRGNEFIDQPKTPKTTNKQDTARG